MAWGLGSHFWQYFLDGEEEHLYGLNYCFPGPQANEVLMGGRKLTATEAYERGLVTRVFSKDEFKQKVKETVGELAKMPPQVSACDLVEAMFDGLLCLLKESADDKAAAEVGG